MNCFVVRQVLRPQAQVPRALHVNLVELRVAEDDGLIVSFRIVLVDVGCRAALGQVDHILQRPLRIHQEVLEAHEQVGVVVLGGIDVFVLVLLIFRMILLLPARAPFVPLVEVLAILFVCLLVRQ